MAPTKCWNIEGESL